MEAFVQFGDVVVGYIADGLLVAADEFGESGEGVTHALGLDVLDTALRHSPVDFDRGQRLARRILRTPGTCTAEPWPLIARGRH